MESKRRSYWTTDDIIYPGPTMLRLPERNVEVYGLREERDRYVVFARVASGRDYMITELYKDGFTLEQAKQWVETQYS